MSGDTQVRDPHWDQPRDENGRFARLCPDCEGRGLMNALAACRSCDGRGIAKPAAKRGTQ